ncbi:MAG TPA: hypothetical protein VEC93_12220 [Anaerolineae bacterium]|nr:hypothetical protein [Anaerolineae bacterium]
MIPKSRPHSGSVVYQIKVKGHLPDRWSEWFDGLAIRHEADGCTILSGPVVDQAALYGILLKLHNLNLPLLSVSRVETKAKE